MMATEETGYQGWANYETWCVSLWLSNDEGLYNLTREMAREFEPEEVAPGVVSVLGLADDLEAFVEELDEVTAVTGGPASLVCDLLGMALRSVDWVEIAENLLTEVAE